MLNWMYWTVVPHLVQVSFGRDFEQQLSFCVEARATFCNLEPVLVQLIHVSEHQFISSWLLLHSTCNLLIFIFIISRRLTSWQWKPEKWWKGITPEKRQPLSEWVLLYWDHRGKRALCCHYSDLISVQACAAYSFITIPSLSNIFSRLNLYLLSGQVALANQCLSQGERLFFLYFQIDLSQILLFSLVLSPCSWFTLKFIFSISWRFPQSSSQYLTRGSSLHQCGREISLFRELPAGLHQQLPGHTSRRPGNTNYLLFLKQNDPPPVYRAQTQHNRHMYSVTCLWW